MGLYAPFLALKNLIPQKLRPSSYCKKFLLNYTNQTVHSGPFKGMKYLNHSLTGAYFPKILGTYELELHPIIGELQKQQFEEVVMIGAGEGYYAVGLSMLLNTSVVAYEKQDRALKSMEELASLNNVRIPKYMGECKPESLGEVSKALVFMDIEGEELAFLENGVIERSRNSYWIIEMHGEEMKKLFLRELKDHYNINFIPCRPRKMQDFPIKMSGFRKWLFRRYWISLMQEWRRSGPDGSVGWLILEPNLKKL